MNINLRRPFQAFLVLTGIFLFIIIGLTESHAADVHFSSGDNKVALVELYTSEGCSSCPPAEKWMGSLKDDKHLWERFVPVAFHVDYWDYIGWKDPFASKDYGRRQRNYRQLGNIRTVYTPGMLLNGSEWRKWHYKRSVPLEDDIVGNLEVVLSGNTLNAVFSAIDEQTSEWVLNVAVLGFKLESNVRSGENSGRKLKQEFVVLGHLQEDSSNRQWQMKLPQVNDEYAKHTGLAVWVSRKGEQTPVQATGGWL